MQLPNRRRCVRHHHVVCPRPVQRLLLHSSSSRVLLSLVKSLFRLLRRRQVPLLACLLLIFINLILHLTPILINLILHLIPIIPITLLLYHQPINNSNIRSL